MSLCLDKNDIASSERTMGGGNHTNVLVLVETNGGGRSLSLFTGPHKKARLYINQGD